MKQIIIDIVQSMVKIISLKRTNRFEQNFVKCFLKDWKNFTFEEKEIHFERKQSLNSKFLFTKNPLRRFRALNEKLKLLENRIRPHLAAISTIQQQWVNLKIIDDYEINFRIGYRIKNIM